MVDCSAIPRQHCKLGGSYFAAIVVAESIGNILKQQLFWFPLGHSLEIHAEKHWLPVCEMYTPSHKRPFVPSVGGIRLLGNV